MKKLVIVESPAKAKTIERFLGNDYRVVASYGHVRDLPSKADQIPEKFRSKDWARLGVDVAKDFAPIYVVPPDKKKHVDMLKKELKGCDELLLATDEDREGESIGWHLLQILKPKVPVRRIAFHEITPEAIREALENPRDVDESLVRSQEARRIVDRLYGYSLSPLLWKKVQRGLSAGRVQSVAVRVCVERERERAAFVSSVYWDMQAMVDGVGQEFEANSIRVDGRRIASGRDFDAETGKLSSKDVALLDERAATDLSRALAAAAPWRVRSVEKKPEKAYPAPPFITSTLQQEANRKLGFSAQRSMRIAQQLYEGVDLGGGERVGLITYMRTDSVTLADRAVRDARTVIADLYGADYLPSSPKQYKTKSRNAQEAHEAIRPTALSRRPEDLRKHLDKEQLKLYDLIWKRTLACQMKNAELLRTQVEIEATADGREVIFGASGKQIVFPGFLRAYVEGSDDPAAELGDKEKILPPLENGQAIQPTEVTPKRHETQPRARYTEASLVRKLEEEGIGRPSTYASIIGTIQDRGYVFKEKNALVPTFTAFAVTILLEENFDDLVDLGFTSRMEEELDEVARGERDANGHLKAFYLGTAKEPGLESRIRSEGPKIDYPAFELRDKRPAATENGNSGAEPIVIRIGNYGPYVQRVVDGEAVSASIPKESAPADFTFEMAEELIAAKARGPVVVGIDPKSGLEITVNEGRFGPYVQLGPTPSRGSKEPAPRRSSLPKGADPANIKLEDALKWLALPRILGVDEASGEEIKANVGRFGPYVQKGGEFRSLEEGDDVYTVQLDRALALLAAPKKPRAGRGGAKSAAPLKSLGKHPDSGKAVVIKDGRYGAYVTDGKTNATLPKGRAPEDVSLEDALTLLAEKAAKGPAKKRGGAKPAAKKAASKNAAPAKKRAATRSKSSKG